jgi:hypothetical protein
VDLLRCVYDVSELEDPDVRAIFRAGEAKGMLKFRQSMRTSVYAYYFFQWKDQDGAWRDGMMTASEVIASFGGRT